MSAHAADYTLLGTPAAAWLLSLLWSAEQGAYAKCRILDALTCDEHGLTGWLFTSVTDGFVKSKARQGWTEDAVARRCTAEGLSDTSSSPTFRAHVGTPLSAPPHANPTSTPAAPRIHWLLPDTDKTLRQHLYRDCLIVSFAHVLGSVSYLEATYECDAAPLAVPKVTIYTLYQGSTIIEENHLKGMNYPHSKNTQKRNPNASTDLVLPAIPANKAACLSKPIANAAKPFLLDLVKQTELRGHIKIARLAVVLLLETLPSSSDADNKVVWLHHCREAVFGFPRRGGGAGQGVGEGPNPDPDRLERRSNTGTDITMSVGGRAVMHKRCPGDFCAYEEEGTGGPKPSAIDESGDIRTEAKKARRRHRADDALSKQLAMEAEAMEEEAKRIGGGASDEAPDDAAGPTPAGVAGSNQLGWQVPFKSIALARSEMGVWQRSQVVTYSRLECCWPEHLFYWWSRQGKAYTKTGGGALPQVSAYSTFQSLAGRRSTSAETRERDTRDSYGHRDIDPNPAHNAPNHPNPTSNRKHSLSSLQYTEASGSQIGSALGAGSGSSMGPVTGAGNEIWYDLDENSFTNTHVKSMGQASWYYSHATVCDRCYAVYRDLDRRRTGAQQALLKKQRAAAAVGQNETLQGKEIERRIFAQRRFATRMSRALLRDPNSLHPNNSSFRSMLRSQDDISDGVSNVNLNPNQGAPRGALPPLPWQLRDMEKGREYEEGSFERGFIKVRWPVLFAYLASICQVYLLYNLAYTPTPTPTPTPTSTPNPEHPQQGTADGCPRATRPHAGARARQEDGHGRPGSGPGGAA